MYYVVTDTSEAEFPTHDEAHAYAARAAWGIITSDNDPDWIFRHGDVTITHAMPWSAPPSMIIALVDAGLLVAVLLAAHDRLDETRRRAAEYQDEAGR